MSFDQERYDREVIRPLRSRRGRLSDDDLLRRYAVDPELRKEELRAHLRRLRTYWNQKSNGADSRAQVCKLLLIADEELQRRVGSALEDPAWWRQQADRSDQAAAAAVEQLAADLTRAYGAVGQVTRAQLERIVAHYPALQPAQVDSAVRTARVRVIDAVELPTTSGLDKVAYRELGSRLREVGAATVVNLIYPDLNRPFTLAREFTVPTGLALALDATVVDRQIAEMEKAADSPAVRARKAALRILRTGLTAGADLRRVALFQIVEQLATDRAAGLADALLVRQATRLGLAEGDAELVVASLPNGFETQSAAASRVRDLLSDGLLRSAQQALAGVVVADPERADLEKAVQGQLAELQQLLAGAEEAVRGQREQEAERLLRAAQRIASDDQDLEARLLRMPIAPPREVSAVAAGAAIRLGWQPPDSAAPDVRYLVVRVEGRAPTSPQDGTRVAETAATTVTDSVAPAARDLHYAVFATGTGGTTWSRAATATTRLVPALAAVKLHARPDEVTASWQAHPSVVEVRVCRTRHRPPARPGDGTQVAATRTSLVDRDVREGEECFYGLTAIYHDERRQEVAAPMTVVSALPRAAAKPLSDLTVSPLVAAGDTLRVRLSWPAAGGQVRIRHATGLPDWEVGDVVAATEVERFGAELAGEPVPAGDRMTLDADVPVGPQVYVPFTIGGTGAVMGDPVELAQSEPVRQLHARRIAGSVVLTWVWPADVRLVEVEWTDPGRPRQAWRLTHSQYVDGTGCALPVGPGGGRAAVRSITIGPTGESYSAPVIVSVPGRAIGLSYALRPPAWRARLTGGVRRRVIEVTADQDCSGIDLAVVVSQGLVMPLSVDQGTVIDRFDGLRLTSDRPVPLEVELPGGLRRPYWIRCFATAPETVTMIDPPITDMKVA